MTSEIKTPEAMAFHLIKLDIQPQQSGVCLQNHRKRLISVLIFFAVKTNKHLKSKHIHSDAIVMQSSEKLKVKLDHFIFDANTNYNLLKMYVYSLIVR